jgi:hypothetical protein
VGWRCGRIVCNDLPPGCTDNGVCPQSDVVEGHLTVRRPRRRLPALQGKRRINRSPARVRNSGQLSRVERRKFAPVAGGEQDSRRSVSIAPAAGRDAGPTVPVRGGPCVASAMNAVALGMEQRASAVCLGCYPIKNTTLCHRCQESIDSDVLILFTVGRIGTGGEPWNFA